MADSDDRGHATPAHTERPTSAASGHDRGPRQAAPSPVTRVRTRGPEWAVVHLEVKLSSAGVSSHLPDVETLPDDVRTALERLPEQKMILEFRPEALHFFVLVPDMVPEVASIALNESSGNINIRTFGRGLTTPRTERKWSLRDIKNHYDFAATQARFGGETLWIQIPIDEWGAITTSLGPLDASQQVSGGPKLDFWQQIDKMPSQTTMEDQDETFQPSEERQPVFVDSAAIDAVADPILIAEILRDAAKTSGTEAGLKRAQALLHERANAFADTEQESALVLGALALGMVHAENIKAELQTLATRARQLGHSWNEIARAAGVAPQTAARRWDDEARKRHRDYQRRRYQQEGPSGVST